MEISICSSSSNSRPCAGCVRSDKRRGASASARSGGSGGVYPPHPRHAPQSAPRPAAGARGNATSSSSTFSTSTFSAASSTTRKLKFFVVVVAIISLRESSCVGAQPPPATTAQPVVPIGVLAPITQRDGRETDISWGNPLRVGCRLAVAAARNNPALSHLNFTLIEADTRGDPGDSFVQTLALSNLSVDANTPARPVHVAVGPTYSSTSLNAALVARSFDLPLISPTATSPSLSANDSYPTFSRTCTSDELQGKALARIVFELGITAVATLSTTESYSSRFTAAFSREATNLSISILTAQTFDEETSELTTEVTAIKNTGVAAIVLILLAPDAVFAFKEFERQGMIGEHYMYFGGDGWIDIDLVSGDDPDEVRVSRWLKGAIGTTGYVPTESDMYKEFESMWIDWYEADNSTTFYIGSPTSWSAYAYDATLLAMHALNTWLESDEPRDERDLLLLIRNTSIVGVTGEFELDDLGDRQGDFFVFNYDGTSTKAIAIGAVLNAAQDFSAQNLSITNMSAVSFPGGQGVLPHTFVPISCANDEQFVIADFNREECDFNGNWVINYKYVEGERPCLEDISRPAAPTGSHPCDFLPFNAAWSIALIAVIIICVALTLAAAVFVVVYRKHKVLVQSQPEMIFCTIVGALTAQLSIIGSIGQIHDGKCVERATVTFVAWIFFFTGIFFKAMRAMEVRQKRVVWMPWRKRMLRLAAFLAVQTTVYTIWITIDPPQVSAFDEAVKQPAGLPRLTIDVQHCVYLDRDSDFVFFYPIMLVINVGWLMYTGLLAFRTRNVKFNHHEAQINGFVILLCLLCACIAAPFLFLDTQGAKERVPRNGLLILFASTSTIMLYVGPKVRRFLRRKQKDEKSEDTFGSLESLLENDISAHYLRQYLETVYATESLEFLDTVMKFQVLVEDARVTDEACLQRCVDIFELHLEKNAERQVNVSGEQRNRVREEVQQLQKDRRRPPVSIFDICIFECKKLIFTNHYYSFLQNGASFAAQRALEWASEYKTMKDKLQRSVVSQLYKEYRHRKQDDKLRHRHGRNRGSTSALDIEAQSTTDEISSSKAPASGTRSYRHPMTTHSRAMSNGKSVRSKTHEASVAERAAAEEFCGIGYSANEVTLSNRNNTRTRHSRSRSAVELPTKLRPRTRPLPSTSHNDNTRSRRSTYENRTTPVLGISTVPAPAKAFCDDDDSDQKQERSPQRQRQRARAPSSPSHRSSKLGVSSSSMPPSPYSKSNNGNGGISVPLSPSATTNNSDLGISLQASPSAARRNTKKSALGIALARSTIGPVEPVVVTDSSEGDDEDDEASVRSGQSSVPVLSTVDPRSHHIVSQPQSLSDSELRLDHLLLRQSPKHRAVSNF